MEEKGFAKVIGKRIMLARRERDMKQSELAERLGVTQNTVSYWETGRRMIGVVTLIQICSILNKPWDWFFTPFDDTDNAAPFVPLAPIAPPAHISQLMPTT